MTEFAHDLAEAVSDMTPSEVEQLAVEVVTAVEIGILVGGAGLLLWAVATRQRWNTLSGLYWLLRERWGWRGGVVLAGATTAALGWVWWHLLFDGAG